MAAENNMEGFKKSISAAINGVNILIIPASIGVMIFSEPVVRVLFGHGAFDEGAIATTSNALFFYSIGMLGFGLREIVSRAFYSLQDTKTPMINAAISTIMNITLNVILSRFMGLSGLALATSISAVFCTCLLLISLRKKIGAFGMKSIIVSFLKITGASLVMGLIVKITFKTLTNSNSQNLSLIMSIVLGIFIYAVMIYFMKIEEVNVVVKAINTKFNLEHNK